MIRIGKALVIALIVLSLSYFFIYSAFNNSNLDQLEYQISDIEAVEGLIQQQINLVAQVQQLQVQIEPLFNSITFSDLSYSFGLKTALDMNLQIVALKDQLNAQLVDVQERLKELNREFNETNFILKRRRAVMEENMMHQKTEKKDDELPEVHEASGHPIESGHASEEPFELLSQNPINKKEKLDQVVQQTKSQDSISAAIPFDFSSIFENKDLR